MAKLEETDSNLKSPNKLAQKAVGLASPVCGVIMPLSAIDDCNEAHWTEVYSIISDAISDAGFHPNIVSNADESGIIQKRIIQNLFENAIVVCDVSGKNPNVMFELGMRLAFDKPTIVIKDDKTDYSFDTSPIEHLGYPRDLRFNKIVDFKQKLREKISATHHAAETDKDYTTFLKHFGEFKIAKIEQKEVGVQEYILDELRELRLSMRRLQFDSKRDLRRIRYDSESEIDLCLDGKEKDFISKLLEKLKSLDLAREVSVRELSEGHSHVILDVSHLPQSARDITRRRARHLIDNLSLEN